MLEPWSCPLQVAQGALSTLRFLFFLEVHSSGGQPQPPHPPHHLTTSPHNSRHQPPRRRLTPSTSSFCSFFSAARHLSMKCSQSSRPTSTWTRNESSRVSAPAAASSLSRFCTTHARISAYLRPNLCGRPTATNLTATITPGSDSIFLNP